MFDKDEVKITDKMGLILKEIRMEKGFSRELIAERAGIGTRHLAAIENEKRAPSIEVFCRIIERWGFHRIAWYIPNTRIVNLRKCNLSA